MFLSAIFKFLFSKIIALFISEVPKVISDVKSDVSKEGQMIKADGIADAKAEGQKVLGDLKQDAKAEVSKVKSDLEAGL